MKKPLPDGSLEGANGSKALAHKLVRMYSLGVDAARFSVVSFAANATTRVGWSYNKSKINEGIDDMSADGKSSISDGFEAVRHLFDGIDANDRRENATKIVLLLSDGEQTIDKAFNKTLFETAVDAANRVKGQGATVFAWGFGENVSEDTLQQIATDKSKAVLANDLAELTQYLEDLEAAVCNESPPLSPPPPAPPPPSPSPPPPSPSPPRPLLTSSMLFLAPSSTWPTAQAYCVAKGGDLVSIHSADEDQLVGAWMKAHTTSSNPWIGLSTQTCSLGCSGNWAAEYSWSDGTATDYSNPVWVQNDNAPTYGHYYRSGSWGTWCPLCKSEGVCLKWS